MSRLDVILSGSVESQYFVGSVASNGRSIPHYSPGRTLLRRGGGRNIRAPGAACGLASTASCRLRSPPLRRKSQGTDVAVQIRIVPHVPCVREHQTGRHLLGSGALQLPQRYHRLRRKVHHSGYIACESSVQSRRVQSIGRPTRSLPKGLPLPDSCPACRFAVSTDTPPTEYLLLGRSRLRRRLASSLRTRSRQRRAEAHIADQIGGDCPSASTAWLPYPMIFARA